MAIALSHTLSGNAFKVFLLWVTLFAGVAAKPSRTRRAVFFSLCCMLFGSILLQPSTSTKPFAAMFRYFSGLAASNLLCQASDFIFLNEPQLTLRRQGQTKLASELNFLPRLSWTNDLISNTRGVNWNYEAPDLRRSTTSRWGFVAGNLITGGYLYLALDLISYAMRHNPAFQHDGNEPMGAHGFIWQAWNAMGYWAVLYLFIRLNHTLGSAIMVLLGEGSPKDYPDMTGPLGKTTTVRKFWGRTWHQSIRRMVSAHGKYFANVFLGYPNGTLMSAYLQLFVAFGVSGLIHGSADFVATRSIGSFNRNLLFFILQAVAISLEDAVIFIGKRLGFERVPKVVGYAWVVVWLSLSGPIWFETLITGRLIQFMLPVSVLDFIVKA